MRSAPVIANGVVIVGAMVATGFVRALPKGHVFFQDIQEHHLKTWESLVRPWAERASFVIGTVTDPKLPESAIDLVVIRDALHEFTQVHEMLARMRESLVPGGYLVVVDRYQGPVRERIPFAERGDDHAFNGEVTTARLGFDAGLLSKLACWAGEKWPGDKPKNDWTIPLAGLACP